MKILIINPNSDLEMTKSIQTSAENFVQGDFEVVCLSTPNAPKFIETYEDATKAAPGMIELIRKNEKKFDAFVVACHCDPNLDTMKEITTKPIVGIGEASMKLASMLGHRFSVVSTAKHSIPNKEALIRKYHLQDLMASVRAPERDTSNCTDEEKYLQAAKLAIEKDMAEVIVLGCAGMTGLDKKLQQKLGVPVLDGVICALIIASGLVKYEIATSKIRRYNPVDLD
ncbi:MAG TPA: aspartate/glutamate racemase family protein [candidate division Zixibacteria bacterium]|nr:aspartate/glutamate racemase family protein [candidate division Zixibacteria bacterium]